MKYLLKKGSLITVTGISTDGILFHNLLVHTNKDAYYDSTDLEQDIFGGGFTGTYKYCFKEKVVMDFTPTKIGEHKLVVVQSIGIDSRDLIPLHRRYFHV